MSNRWPAQSQGSLVTRTSPGCRVSAGKCSRSAFTACGRAILKTGIARGEWASGSPSGSTNSQAKSWASEMISEKAVRPDGDPHFLDNRHQPAPHDLKRDRACLDQLDRLFDRHFGRHQSCCLQCVCYIDPDIADGIDISAVTRRNNGRGLMLLDDRWPFDRRSDAEKIAIIDRRLVRLAAEPGGSFYPLRRRLRCHPTWLHPESDQASDQRNGP